MCVWHYECLDKIKNEVLLVLVSLFYFQIATVQASTDNSLRVIYALAEDYVGRDTKDTGTLRTTCNRYLRLGRYMRLLNW